MEAERPQREETGGGENAGAPSTEAAPSTETASSAPQQDAPSSKDRPIPEKEQPSPPKAPTPIGGSKDIDLDLPVFVMCPKEELEARLRSAHKWHREAEKKTGSPLKERGVILSHLICDEVDQITDELVASYLAEMENLAKTDDDDDDKGEPPSFKWAEVKEGPWPEVKEGPWPFDVANILLCVALARYAAASKESREGGTQGLKVAFHSLKQIAGLLKYCVETLPKTAALRGDTAILAKVALCDASAITVAMAAASGRTHKLVASCAHHAALAAQWDDEEDEGPKKAKKTSCSHRKWSKYLAWKRQVHLALAWAHQGLHNLQLEEGGTARRCTGEGVAALSEGALFRDDYDALKPWRPHDTHASFDAAILKFVTDTDRKAERENAMVHFKSVPQDLPDPLSSAVPDVAAIGPSGFPDAKETAIDISEEEDGKCECSWKHVLIFPLLVILSLISAIVWVLLLPLKCIPCCCPLGTGLQVLWDTIEYFLRRPLKACL